MMARRYEYIIHGPPLSPPSNSQTTTPRKTLHSRRDSQKVTNLRSLYRNSASPTQLNESIDSSHDRRVPSPTTPKLPPTPPAGDEHIDSNEQWPALQETEPLKPASVPTTPVNQNSPPTPEDTPPRNTLKAPVRPHLALRPSIASTRAESFKTAHENLYSDDEFYQSPPALRPTFSGSVSDLTGLNNELSDPVPDSMAPNGAPAPADNIDDDISSSSAPLPPETGDELLDKAEKDTPETQFRFEHSKDDRNIGSEKQADVEHDRPDEILDEFTRLPSVYEQVTVPLPNDPPGHKKSLRNRLQEGNRVPKTASTEAFAHIIGWNDGTTNGMRTDSENQSNRWSGNSNPSAVEAYVVESPIKPRKRGTLRKVVKNDSLRVASSPVQDNKRASVQSNSDSSHRLVHKKAKLTNQNRWSTGSDLSRQSLSLNSFNIGPKPEVIKVAVVPERSSSLHTSTSSSRRHSRSVSAGSTHARSTMPPVSTPVPRRKRAFSDSIERTSLSDKPAQVPMRRSSTPVPMSRSASKENSMNSEQFSLQRQQAEKDLRVTLDRMESERLSASLRWGSNQSSSPTPPAPRPTEDSSAEAGLKPDDTQLPRRISSTGTSTRSGRRPSAIGIGGSAPGSKEWADLRPPTVVGTPFSQTSVMSTSPEIIEAKVVSFFPHHNESLQLIEPNRLSETPAVRALKDQSLGRPKTEASVNITTPRTSDHLTQSDVIDSPLRNPRKPPEPPQFEFIPATPLSELNKQLGVVPGPNPVRSRQETLVKRPALQGRDRSESFLKQLTRNFSTRNAKNPKAGKDLDSTLHPFWRPRAFWDENGNPQRTSQELERERERERAQMETETMATNDGETMRTVTILEPPMIRSNSITTGPISLMRKISERKKNKKVMDDHIVQHQALVKQNSYSSLQRIRVGRKLYGMPPMRSLSLNMGMGKLRGLQDRMVAVRARREDEKRERRREALRKSIGAEVISQGDSRFIVDRNVTRNVDPTEEVERNATAQEPSRQADWSV